VLRNYLYTLHLLLRGSKKYHCLTFTFSLDAETCTSAGSATKLPFMHIEQKTYVSSEFRGPPDELVINSTNNVTESNRNDMNLEKVMIPYVPSLSLLFHIEEKHNCYYQESTTRSWSDSVEVQKIRTTNAFSISASVKTV
jgi:hypothetical protein